MTERQVSVAALIEIRRGILAVVTEMAAEARKRRCAASQARCECGRCQRGKR